jgi:hypothetical protein
MSHSWETILATIGCNSIRKKKMAAINADLDAVAEQSDNSVVGYRRIVGSRGLVYGFRSCHWGKYLRTGETDALQQFAGKSLAGHPLITDPEQLSALAQAGALQLDEIYALPSRRDG